MKQINKSSKECAELNAANAEGIALGLVDEVQPTPEILKKETEAAARAQREASNAEEAKKICTAVFGKLSAEARALYTGTIRPVNTGGDIYFDGTGPCVRIEAYYQSSGYYSSNFSYWRICVGPHGDVTRIKIGDKIENSQKLTDKIAAAIEEKVTHLIQQKKQQAAREGKAAEKKLFFSANREVLERVGISEYNAMVSGDKIFAPVQLSGITAGQLERLAVLLDEFKAENQPQAVNA